jgi:CRISPR-associated exonuclease Cas4
VDREFEDNVHTARGSAEHERADRDGYVAGREGARIEYSLPVWSERIGLSGRCDVVEFWPDGTVFPVEYKHGPRRKWLNDDLQIAAQAMCLEEMFGRKVSNGAVFHHGSRRRREVTIDAALRAAVESAVASIRAILNSGTLPDPVNDRRCGECSMNTLCQPEIAGARDRLKGLRDSLFTVANTSAVAGGW